MRTPVLETARLLLRPLRIEDAGDGQALFADWDVVKHLDGAHVPWPYPDDGAYSHYSQVTLPKAAAGEWLVWAITVKPAGRFIGVLTLKPDAEDENRGFWLGQAYWGKGFITEAIVATTDYAFDVLTMPHLRLANAAANRASSRVKEKAGATLLGVVDHIFVDGPGAKETWLLTPEAWRASAMKREAADPSYVLR